MTLKAQDLMLSEIGANIFLRNSLGPPIHFSNQTWQRNQSARWQITNLEKFKSGRASR